MKIMTAKMADAAAVNKFKRDRVSKSDSIIITNNINAFPATIKIMSIHRS